MLYVTKIYLSSKHGFYTLLVKYLRNTRRLSPEDRNPNNTRINFINYHICDLFMFWLFNNIDSASVYKGSKEVGK